MEIFNSLRNRRFLLLLDDVWERLDLTDIGIPPPGAGNKCKIILTTRSREVGRDMDAKIIIKMTELNEHDGGVCSRRRWVQM